MVRNEPFSLAGRGAGECGAGVMDVIKLDIDEAKDALKKAPADSENVYKAIVASARALLVTVGLEPKKDREIFAAFTEHLIKPRSKPFTQERLVCGPTHPIHMMARFLRELKEPNLWTRM